MDPKTHTLHNTDIPQSNSLPRVRLVVEAVAGGAATVDEMAERTGMDRRQIDYALQAARILGWVLPAQGEVAHAWEATAHGAALVRTGEASAHERACFRESFERSPELQALVPDLLAAHPPSEEQLVTRLQRVANCSQATAARRAKTLLAWRAQILDPQGDLFK